MENIIKPNKSIGTYYVYFTFSLILISLLAIVALILSEKGIIPGSISRHIFPDPLAIVGYIFWLIAIWAAGSIFFGVFKNVKNKMLALILSIAGVIALYIFIKIWFFWPTNS